MPRRTSQRAQHPSRDRRKRSKGDDQSGLRHSPRVSGMLSKKEQTRGCWACRCTGGAKANKWRMGRLLETSRTCVQTRGVKHEQTERYAEWMARQVAREVVMDGGQGSREWGVGRHLASTT